MDNFNVSQTTDSDMSYMPAYMHESLHLDERQTTRIFTAFEHAVKGTNTEHHVARAVLLLIDLFFQKTIWNMVPQYYTNSGHWPDLVLEIFQERSESVRNNFFLTAVIIEFKRAGSNDDPIQQMKDSILFEYGPLHSTRGILIGVKGLQFRIVEYHLIGIPYQGTDELVSLVVTKDFYDHDGPPVEDGRPKALKTYLEGTYMDFAKKDEGCDILNALTWIAKGKKTRDLTYMKPGSKTLPNSISHATVDIEMSGEIVEKPLQPTDDFKYIAEHLNEWSAGKDLSKEGQTEVGGPSQESRDMVVD